MHIIHCIIALCRVSTRARKLTLPANSSSTDDTRPPSRLALTRKALEKRTASGIASSLPTVTPAPNRLRRRGDGNGKGQQEGVGESQVAKPV